HVGVITFPEWEANAELWVELGKLLQAGELIFASCAGPHVQRDTQLVMRDASHHDPLALLGLFHMRSAGTGPLLTDAYTRLLFCRAVCGRDRDGAMHALESVKKGSGR